MGVSTGDNRVPKHTLNTPRDLLSDKRYRYLKSKLDECREETNLITTELSTENFVLRKKVSLLQSRLDKTENELKHLAMNVNMSLTIRDHTARRINDHQAYVSDIMERQLVTATVTNRIRAIERKRDESARKIREYLDELNRLHLRSIVYNSIGGEEEYMELWKSTEQELWDKCDAEKAVCEALGREINELEAELDPPPSFEVIDVHTLVDAGPLFEDLNVDEDYLPESFGVVNDTEEGTPQGMELDDVGHSSGQGVHVTVAPEIEFTLA